MTEQLNLFDHWPEYSGPVMLHPLRDVHRNMLQRCSNPKAPDFPRYGGRGLVVDPAFRSSRSFIGWAIWSGWRPGLQLDRHDNDAGYSPANCRFVTRSQNCLNKRKTVRLSDGRAAWEVARSLGLNRKTFSYRIRLGWSPDDAATVPAGSKRPLPDARQSAGDVAAQAVGTSAAQLQANGRTQ